MERQANADSTDDLCDKDSNNDPTVNPIKVDLSDIMLPTTSPPISSLNPMLNPLLNSSLNNGSAATPYVNQPRENPQKRKNSPPLEIVSKKLCENLYNTNDDSSTDIEEYTITITDDENNFQLRNYIEEGELLGDVVIKRDESNEVRLTFENIEDYHIVSNRIKTRENKFNSNLPKQEVDVPDNQSDSAEVPQHSVINDETGHIIMCRSCDGTDCDWLMMMNTVNNGSSSWNSTENVEYKDPLGLYGLQLEFLKSLEITPPLDRWVHVTNFRCDKSELREVMELAGRVVSCSVITTTKRYAKVQYSHTLEAVQAVSMLNGQIYYGQKLSVYIERNPRNDIILPKGLANIGIGLGISGRPIRDIVSQYKNFTRKQTSTINPVLFRKLVFEDCKEEIQKQEESEIDFKALMTSQRSFEVKHVEDLDNADGVPSEKTVTKDTNSPETISMNSIDSPISNHEVKDDLKVDKSNDNNNPQNYSDPASRAQSDVLGTVRARRPTPAVGFPRPIVPQNLRTQPLQSTPYRPGASTSTALISNSQCPRPFSINSTPNVRPLSVPHSMPNPIGNPPTPGPFGLSQPYKPPSPTSTIPVNNPAPVYGLSSMYSPGVVPGPPIGIGHRPGPMHGPRPFSGPVQLSNLAHGPGSNPGPSNLSHGHAPNPGPSNFTHGPPPNQGPPNLTHGPASNQGPSNFTHGPPPNQGASNLAPSVGSNLGLSHLAHGPGPNPGPSSLIQPPAPNQGPSNFTHVPPPNQGPSNVAHGPGPNQGQGPMQGTGLPQLSVPPPLLNNASLSSVPGSGSVTGVTPIGHPPTKVDVEFANLPPSTTFPFLCEKLSQCGQVTCLRFTTPGCAIASFSHPAHAERCYQNYNGMVVEGFRIIVKLV